MSALQAIVKAISYRVIFYQNHVTIPALSAAQQINASVTSADVSTALTPREILMSKVAINHLAPSWATSVWPSRGPDDATGATINGDGQLQQVVPLTCWHSPGWFHNQKWSPHRYWLPRSEGLQNGNKGNPPSKLRPSSLRKLSG